MNTSENKTYLAEASIFTYTVHTVFKLSGMCI